MKSATLMLPRSRRDERVMPPWCRAALQRQRDALPPYCCLLRAMLRHMFICDAHFAEQRCQRLLMPPRHAV